MSRYGSRRAVSAACVGLTAIAVVLPCRLSAQGMEFIPYGGVILPLGKLVEQGRANISHVVNVAFGGRVDGWLSPRTGLEVAVSYAPSGFHAADTLGTSLDTTGGLFSVTGRVLYRFARTGAMSWHVLAGAGVLIHSGAYIANLTGKKNLTGVVGVTGRFQISGGTAITLTTEDYVYSVKFGGIPGIAPAARLNNDVVFSLGLVVPLGARGEDDYMRVFR